MKELEKTKRISISAILFLLVIIVGLLTFKKPSLIFQKDALTTHEYIKAHSYFINTQMLMEMDEDSYMLIDTRSNFEFVKGHLKNAVNIPKSEIIQGQNIETLKIAKSKNKTLVLYDETPELANSSIILLYQLGYDKTKLLTVKAYYHNNEFNIVDINVEKPAFDFAKTMKEAGIAPVKKTKLKVNTEPQKKKVVTKPKKKKKMPEGGC